MKAAYITTEVVREILRAASELGIDIAAARGLLMSPATTESMEQDEYFKFWTETGSRRMLELATRIALRVRPGDLGLLDYVIHNASSVRIVMHHLTEHLDYSYTGSKLALRTVGDAVELFYRSPNTSPAATRWTVGFAHSRLRAMVGEAWRLKRVGFEFERPDDAQELEDFFGCAIEYSNPETTLRFSAKFLDFPVIGADEKLYRVLFRQLERELGERRQKNLDSADQIRTVLKDALKHGETTRELVAARIGIPPSKLSEKLLDLGHRHFGDYLNEFRKTTAQELLADPSIAVSQISRSLGYTDTSNFTRAFRRWYGVSPSAYRRANSS